MHAIWWWIGIAVAAFTGVRAARAPKLSHFWRHFLVDVAIGVAIECGIQLVERSALVTGPDNAAMDFMVRLVGPTARDARPGTAFVFLDIDDSTFTAWGEPLVTPRRHLARLVDFAATGGASLVVVDVNVARPSGANGDSVSPDDAALHRALADRDSTVPVLVAAGLRDGPRGALPAAPRSFLLDLGPLPNVRWATVGFAVDADGVLRRWRLWEDVCDGGRPAVLASVQLRAAALLEEPPASAELDRLLEEHRRPSCGPSGEGHGEEHAEETALHIAGRPLVWGEEPVGQRILYGMPWRLDREDDARPMVQLRDGRSVPDLTIVPAVAVTDTTRPVSAELVRGRVVIIGGSFADGRDRYTTPLGEMPGALVLANAMASLRDHGQIRKPSVLLDFLMIVLGAAIVALLFMRFHHLPAALLSAVVIFALSLSVGYFLFQGAVWFSFALPLLAIQVHSFLAQFKEWYGLARQRGKGAHE